MSKWNSPKPNKAGRRCTVCGSPYHDRRDHTVEEQLASREVKEAPALERKYGGRRA